MGMVLAWMLRRFSNLVVGAGVPSTGAGELTPNGVALAGGGVMVAAEVAQAERRTAIIISAVIGPSNLRTSASTCALQFPLKLEGGSMMMSEGSPASVQARWRNSTLSSV